MNNLIKMNEAIKTEVDEAIKIVCNEIKRQENQHHDKDSSLPALTSALAELVTARAKIGYES